MCQLLLHLQSSEDHYFDNVGMVVDVFHAKTKHRETDTFCQANCNPARFKEILTDDNRWVFNSSAAEPANKWFGQFQAIVRKMPVLK
jgi:hypothetical protein